MFVRNITVSVHGYFVGFSTLGVEMFDRNITFYYVGIVLYPGVEMFVIYITVSVLCYFVGLVLYLGSRDV